MKYPVLIIILIAFLSGCYKEGDYDYTADEIFKHLNVSFSKDSIPADLTSSTVMTIQMPITSDTNLTRFNLGCSKCLFVESESDKLTTNISMVADDEEHRYVEVPIKASNSIGQGTVNIELAGYEKAETFGLFKSEASEISLSGSVNYLRNDTITEVVITAVVKSESGLASKDVDVAFSASFNPAYNGPAGFFFTETPVGIGSASTASNTYLFQGDGSYTGQITFTATLPDHPSISAGTAVVHVIN